MGIRLGRGTDESIPEIAPEIRKSGKLWHIRGKGQVNDRILTVDRLVGM